jgi:hypothetical protein
VLLLELCVVDEDDEVAEALVGGWLVVAGLGVGEIVELGGAAEVDGEVREGLLFELWAVRNEVGGD